MSTDLEPTLGKIAFRNSITQILLRLIDLILINIARKYDYKYIKTQAIQDAIKHSWTTIYWYEIFCYVNREENTIKLGVKNVSLINYAGSFYNHAFFALGVENFITNNDRSNSYLLDSESIIIPEGSDAVKEMIIESHSPAYTQNIMQYDGDLFGSYRNGAERIADELKDDIEYTFVSYSDSFLRHIGPQDFFSRACISAPGIYAKTAYIEEVIGSKIEDFKKFTPDVDYSDDRRKHIFIGGKILSEEVFSQHTDLSIEALERMLRKVNYSVSAGYTAPLAIRLPNEEWLSVIIKLQSFGEILEGINETNMPVYELVVVNINRPSRVRRYLVTKEELNIKIEAI